MAIIEVKHVTKEFRLGQLQSVKLSLQRMVASLSGHPLPERPDFKALDEVDFKIEAGEVVGIIGHNGAGKSTLLKLLSRITVPSAGSIKVGGKVAPLIEVGAGLVGELTGRENIYLNGAILGMRKAEIRRKFDEIVAFSELERFIDTPLKRYSSGMQVRLGFAIATSVDAEILIVDEVLAVGDLAFQRKSFDRMESYLRNGNRTVILVSHNIRQVERICGRVLLLDQGHLVCDGNAEKACALFLEQSNARIAHEKAGRLHGHAKVLSSGEVEVLAIEVLDSQGRTVETILSGAELRVRVRFRLNEPLVEPQLIIGTHTSDFVYLTAGYTGAFGSCPDLAAGEHEAEYTVPAFPLVPGIYCLRFGVYDRNLRPAYVGESLATFHVKGLSSELKEAGMRLLNIPGVWRVDGQSFAINREPDFARVERASIQA